VTTLIAAGTVALAVNFLMLVVSGRRLTRARPLRVALYALANVALIAITAAAIGPGEWIVATITYIAILTIGCLRLTAWTAVARIFFSLLVALSVFYLAYVAELTFLSGLGLLAAVLSGLLLLFEVAALALAGTYAYETLDALCRVRWRRRVLAPPPALGADAPFVSIHIPTYSEPPELVIETLDALARLDYPSYEVIVVDNNTKDSSLWRPVQEHCARLGSRFRFFHVDPLSGFKSGACNFALRETDARAEIIGIVDADYLVDPAFLKECVPHFRDPRIAFVQTPQDYREFEGNRYLTDCLRAYAYFFAVSMVARNEYNASIFGGTMGLIRRSALEDIGGWDEWCITEDAEASLRILQRGHESLFVPKTYGRGLMPFDFDGYKKQRFRWCFGGVQILRKHWRALVPFVRRPAGDRLTTAQRLWYLMAAVQWFGEPLQLAFTAFLITGALAYAVGGGLVARPLVETALLFPLVFLGLGILRFLWGLRLALHISLRDAIGAALSMFSLSWVVTQAALTALVRADGVFLRTSKARARTALGRALHSTRWESGLGIASLTVAGVVLSRESAVLGGALATLCLWQGLVYLSAFMNCLSAVRSASVDSRPARYRRGREAVILRIAEPRTALAAGVALATFLALGTVAMSPPVVEEFARAPLQDSLIPFEERRSAPTPGPRAPGVLPVQAASPRPAASTATPAPTLPGVRSTPSALPTPSAPSPAATAPAPPKPSSVPTPRASPPLPRRR
jgi:cellulose synthase/poly-beta-1,6-N-acetylglucosamine synthase-like glycosyltransferase